MTLGPNFSKGKLPPERKIISQPNEEIKIVKINGIESSCDIQKVKKWLVLYDELQSEIEEDHYPENDPEAIRVGNGVFTVKMIKSMTDVTYLSYKLKCKELFLKI